MENDPDLLLDEQMSNLEGIPLDIFADNSLTSTPANNLVETAETLRGEVPLQPEQSAVNQQVNTQAVQPTATPVQAPSQMVQTPQVPPVITPQKVQAAPVVDLDAAPVFVSVSPQSTTQTDYLKLKEGEMTRVALVGYNASQTHFHYEQGLGYFKCLSTYEPGSDWPTLKDICCLQPNQNDKTKIVGKGKKKIFLPVVEYPISHADGKSTIPNGTPKLRILSLSGKEWGTIAEYRDAYPDATTIDLFIKRKKDESNYLTYATTPMPTVRANYNGLVEAEAAKITNRTYNLAAEEFAKTLNQKAITDFYANKGLSELMANQLANQPVPTPEMLGL